MDIEVRLTWTPSQWRRFLGLADITPLVEVSSVMIDRMVMGIIDQRLEALTMGSKQRRSEAVVAEDKSDR